jgi:CsoR family transcriptional regulator, copper-sensing transcriptional repressor
MKHGYYDSKPDLMKRLNRASGQIGGIAKMIENDTYCIDILTQISAVRSALDKVALELVSDHTRHCMNEADPRLRDEKAAELNAALARFMK